MENSADQSTSSSNVLRTSTESETGKISLTLRIPPFWRDRPRLWFISFEAATHDLKKGQAQLAQMVIAQLERQDIEQITDILYNPPESGQYDAIKERLISAYEESDSRQFQKLLSEMELGDQKPTQLLRRMRNLARDKVPDSTLRLMWTNHLPPHVRSVLAVSESFTAKTQLEELALLADKMIEQAKEVASVSAITPRSPPSLAQEDVLDLKNELRKLSLEVAELRSNSYRRSYNRYPPRYHRRNESRSQSRSRSQTPSDSSPVCYYHHKFGTNARKCTSPCNFNNNKNNNNSNNNINKNTEN